MPGSHNVEYFLQTLHLILLPTRPFFGFDSLAPLDTVSLDPQCKQTEARLDQGFATEASRSKLEGFLGRYECIGDEFEAPCRACFLLDSALLA